MYPVHCKSVCVLSVVESTIIKAVIFVRAYDVYYTTTLQIQNGEPNRQDY